MKISVAFVAVALAAAAVQALPVATTILINDHLEVRAPTPGINGATDVLKDLSASTPKGIEEGVASLDLGRGKEPKLDAAILLGKGKESDNPGMSKAVQIDTGDTGHQGDKVRLTKLKIPKASDFEAWLFKRPSTFSIDPNGQRAHAEHVERLQKAKEIVENNLKALVQAKEEAPLVDNSEKIEHLELKNKIISENLERYKKSTATRQKSLEEYELDKGPEAWMHKHYGNLQ